VGNHKTLLREAEAEKKERESQPDVIRNVKSSRHTHSSNKIADVMSSWEAATAAAD